MPDKLLISADVIARYRPLSKGIPASRMEPYIREAQYNDLRPILGDPLFLDFMKKFDASGDPMYADYQKLLLGDEYTPPGDTATIEYPGIVPMLAYYTLARFVEGNRMNVTTYGVVQKVTEQSEPMGEKLLDGAIASFRSNGYGFEQALVKYLRDKGTSVYPLYRGAMTESLNTSGVKFFDL
jgi:hypothetical protein